MSTTVKTVIKNNGRGNQHLVFAKGKDCKIRSGETVVLDYDVWSFVTKSIRNRLEYDMKRGILDITTKVLTGNTSVTMDGNGSVSMKEGIDEEFKETVKEKLPPVDSKSPLKEVKNETLESTVATKSKETMEKSMGATATIVGVEEDKTEVIGDEGINAHTNNIMGASKKETAKVENVYTAAPVTETKETSETTVEEVKTVEAKEEAKTETSEKDKEEPATEDKDKEETASEEQKETSTVVEDAELANYIDNLYAVKDYKTILTQLEQRFPEIEFAKATIRKCVSFEDLKSKYPEITI